MLQPGLGCEQCEAPPPPPLSLLPLAALRQCNVIVRRRHSGWGQPFLGCSRQGAVTEGMAPWTHLPPRPWQSVRFLGKHPLPTSVPSGGAVLAPQDFLPLHSEAETHQAASAKRDSSRQQGYQSCWGLLDTSVSLFHH